MQPYLDALRYVLDHGEFRQGPQAAGAKTVSGLQMRFRHSDGFPLITCRSLKGSWKALRAELLWMLTGSTNVRDLHEVTVHFWDSWADANHEKLGLPEGELGRIYGAQWRNFRSFSNYGNDIHYRDQIAMLVRRLKQPEPFSRRAFVSTWNPCDFDESDLREKVFIVPCHGTFQCIAYQDAAGKRCLDLVSIHRAGDMGVGVPWDIALYGLLHRLIAEAVGMEARELVVFINDAHIYTDQIACGAIDEMLTRTPKSRPTLTIDPRAHDILENRKFKIADYLDCFVLENYDPHPAIKGIPVQL